MRLLVVSVALVVAIASCTQALHESSRSGASDVNASSTTTPVNPGPENATDPVLPLSWERGHPERAAWSRIVYHDIRKELFSDFDRASDAERFCPAYRRLNDDEKASMWSELISAIAKFESGWNPLSRMAEPSLGTDHVTGQTVYSEGLLQLSYQDVAGRSYCRFDWQADKDLAPTDGRKTILDPARNLECGIRILAAQIRNRGSVILSSNVYWAVLKDGGRYQKIDEIVAMTRAATFCH